MAAPEDVDGVQMTGAEAAAFRTLLDRLSAEYNFDFRSYKTASLARRIRARMAQLRIDGFDAYAEYLERHADEPVALFNMILINVTGFFRDPEAWEVLGREAMPALVAEALVQRNVRVWSAGCSTGEEAYSVAIVLAEALGDRAHEVDVKIYATDIDEEALTTARQGLYRLEQLKELPEAFVDRYFAREGQLHRFRRDLRRWCIFGRHNLVHDAPLSHVDLLVCRNVLIYFKNDLQERLLHRFRYALREGGFLFLGKSESLLARSRFFTPVSAKWRLFRRAPQAAAPPELAALRRPVESAAAETEREAPVLDLARVVEGLPAAVVVVDTRDAVLAWNAAATALYEIPVNAAVGKPFRDLDISYRIEGLRARIEDVKTSRTASRLEDAAFNRRSGEPVHVDVAITPLIDDRGRVTAVLVAAIDVTERARLREEIGRLADDHATATEELQSTNEELETTNEELQSTNEELETTNEELQSTNEELITTVDELQAANTAIGARTAEARRLALYQESVVNSVSEAIIVLDRDLVVTSWNPAAERLWGLRKADALGRPFFVLPIGPVTGAARAGMARVNLGDRGGDVLDVPFDLAGVPHVLRLLPLRDAQGELQGVLAITRPEAGAG